MDGWMDGWTDKLKINAWHMEKNYYEKKNVRFECMKYLRTLYCYRYLRMDWNGMEWNGVLYYVMLCHM